jgi:hypothetical protein
MANQRPTTLSIDDQLSDIFYSTFSTEMNLESSELSTSYLNSSLQHSNVTDTTTNASLSAAAVASSSPSKSDDNDSQTSTIREEYQVRTLGPHNIARLSILPIYPHFSLTPATPTTPTTTSSTSSRTPHLLLSNVPSKMCSQ